MTIVQPPKEESPHPGGYVPAAEGADGNEDPVPEPVMPAAAPAPSGPDSGAGAGADRQSDDARRVGQLLFDFAEPESTSRPLQMGESVCTACAGRGETPVGVVCVQCTGSGVVLAKVGHLR